MNKTKHITQEGWQPIATAPTIGDEQKGPLLRKEVTADQLVQDHFGAAAADDANGVLGPDGSRNE